MKPPVSAARRRRTRRLHQRAEQSGRKRIAPHPLRMPLNADDPMFMRLMLDGFDHSIRSNRGDAQTAPQITDGLMMRSVYTHAESSATTLKAASGRELGNLAAWLNTRLVRRVGRIWRETLPAVLDFRV